MVVGDAPFAVSAARQCSKGVRSGRVAKVGPAQHRGAYACLWSSNCRLRGAAPPTAASGPRHAGTARRAPTGTP